MQQHVLSEKVKEALRQVRWNGIVPRRAIETVEGSDHFRFLHPTKGWRYVSKKRLGF